MQKKQSGVSWLSVASLAALAAIGLTIPTWRSGSSGHTAAQTAPGFRDAAETSGIDFQMSFLPGEQGENFKVNLYDHGCGVAIADYDSDGDDDVLLLNQLGANALYRNRGDGTFENDMSQADTIGLADRVCVGAAFGDYDNDGDQDLYITSTRGGNVLLENDAGRFRDVTEASSVGLVAHSQTAAFFDYDNDGFLDLFVTNTARWTTDDYNAEQGYYRGAGDLWSHVYNVADRESNVLYRNNRDGTFTDVTSEAGLAGKGWGGDLAAFDADQDGLLDLFVTNMFGMSQLYRNDGQGHFHDITREAMERTSLGAIGCKAFDYNNDGRLDLFMGDMHSDMWLQQNEAYLVKPQKKYRHIRGPDIQLQPQKLAQEAEFMERLGLNYDELLFGNSLFRNDGATRFAEVSDAACMETFWPWGVAVGDFNNDGFEDVFVPSGMGFPFFYWPNSLMMNGGDGTFRDEAARHGIEPPIHGMYFDQTIAGKKATRASRCAATADFDGDGRLELIVNNFNDRPYYFRNQFPSANYVEFKLTGTKSNRDAIGALVSLHSGHQVMVRQVHCAGGYLSQSSKTLHFGLGDRTKMDKAEIRWPSGAIQTVDVAEVNRVYEVREPSD